MNKKRQTVIAVIGLLGVLAIILGVTYAWFSYAKTGTKDNVITAGKVEFIYTEESPALAIDDMMPMTDAQGRAQTDYFDFKVSAETANSASIPYTVTVRVKDDSTLNADVVKVLLTDNTNTDFTGDYAGVKYFQDTATPSRTAGTFLATYQNATFNPNNKNERIIYQGTVPAGQSNYVQNFRLRMWIDEKADYSQVEVTKYYCDGVEVNQNDYANCETNPTTNRILEYPYNDKMFKITVNVYADGVVVNTQIPTSSTTLYTSGSIKDSEGRDAEIGSSVTLSAYDSGYSLNDSGQVYKAYIIENGIVTEVDLCKKETSNAPAICLAGGEPTKYSLNKANLLSYFGGNENNWPSECSEETNFGTKELTCANSYVVLAADDAGGLFINDIEHRKSCVVNPEFGIYNCQ